MPLPGDELVPDPGYEHTRAVTVHAPADEVWRWLAQIGQGRGGFYSYDWLENLAGCDIHSADRIHPEWQDLEVGDRVLDGAPEMNCAFVVTMVDPHRHLVLHSTEHLPPDWAERYGASLDWSWAFVLEELAGDRTRSVVRSRLHLEPRWVEAFYLAAIVPALAGQETPWTRQS